MANSRPKVQIGLDVCNLRIGDRFIYLKLESNSGADRQFHCYYKESYQILN